VYWGVHPSSSTPAIIINTITTTSCSTLFFLSIDMWCEFVRSISHLLSCFDCGALVTFSVKPQLSPQRTLSRSMWLCTCWLLSLWWGGCLSLSLQLWG
jgi:uncharacterized membrane protein